MDARVLMTVDESPDDRLVRLQPKIQEPASPAGVLVQELRTENPAIRIPLADLLSALD